MHFFNLEVAGLIPTQLKSSIKRGQGIMSLVEI